MKAPKSKMPGWFPAFCFFLTRSRPKHFLIAAPVKGWVFPLALKFLKLKESPFQSYDLPFSKRKRLP
jgi:hypothetical protein